MEDEKKCCGGACAEGCADNCCQEECGANCACEDNKNCCETTECCAGNKNMKMFVYGLAGFLAVVLVLALGVGIFRVYAKGSTDAFTVTIAKVLRLPVAKVAGDSVLFSDYAGDLKAIKQMRDFDQANGGANGELTDQDLSDQVLWRLANNVLLKKAALTYNVKVEDEDVQKLRAQLLEQFQTEEAINKELIARYGWDLDTYEKKVMRNYVVQIKLAEAITGDTKAREEVRNLALQVLNEAKGGADFAELAKKYGQDGTRDSGGDLGFFARGQMVPTFEDAAFALKPGEISTDLVETEYGYHIIKTEETKTETVKNATTGRNEKQEQVRARHILLRFPDINTYLDTAASQANIRLYANIHDPFVEVVK